MKTIEEKAKRYDEILARAEGANLPYYKEEIMSKVREFVNYLLPELAESEDERMSKYLIKYFEANKDELSKGFKWNGITVEECIAWLEKQGEQKYINYSKQCADYKKDSELQMPRLTEFENELATILFEREYEGSTETEADIIRGRLEYELAAIRLSPKLLSIAIKEQKEAKGNDREIPNSEQKPYNKIEPKFKVGDIVKHKNNPHLTYILKRFTDNGDYEFHAIGKDGNEGCTCFYGVKYQDEWELVEQKPAEWSEEDEKCIRLSTDIIDSALRAGFCVQLDRDRCVDWLKSLRPQKLWKPTEKQMKAIEHICDGNIHVDLDILDSIYKDFKKLREEYA